MKNIDILNAQLKQEGKMKFFVMHGKQNPGFVNCKYSFYSVIDLDEDDLEEETRKYAWREFYSMGANPKNMKNDAYVSKKNLFLNDGTSFVKEAIVHHHTQSFLIFIPGSNILNFFR